MSQKFDLVIIGGSCIGMAAAYYALKLNRTVCILEKRGLGDDKKFWSDSFVARQNRMQYNEEYLTKFVKASNNQWKYIQQQLGKGKPFLYRQGALWFGDKHVNTTMGNIKAAEQSFTMINSNLLRGEKKVGSLYIETIMQDSPQFMNAFKPAQNSQWDNWSSLYQPDGGSIDMKGSYDAFYLYIKSHPDKVKIYDNNQVVKHEKSTSQFKHKFTTSTNKLIEGKSVFICTGVYTPHFLKEVMDFPYLVDSNMRDSNREYTIEEYVSSYFKIEEGYENFYSHVPSFINFMKENTNDLEFTTYGFPYHIWDSLKTGRYVKLGTLASKKLTTIEQETNYLKSLQLRQLGQEDHRVRASINYASKRMNGINPKNGLNKHFPYPMIFYEGRQTILDYLQRKDDSVVVQSGGWVSNEYPLMAKIAVQMLFEPTKIRKEKMEYTAIGGLLNKSRFPLKPYVNDRINNLNYQYPQDGQFKTVIIGAGCAGIYSAYRLNKANKENIGVFDLSDRISGGLKSFQIRGTNTPIELEDMKYIPDKHSLLNELVQHLGIPNIPFPVEGQRTLSILRRSSLKNEYPSLTQLSSRKRKQLEGRSLPNIRIKGQLLGMSAYQIICLSLYQILTAPENVAVLAELFLEKTKEDIILEKEKANSKGQIVHVEDTYYRNWQNYVYFEKKNPLEYHINLTLQQWNKIRPILLFRFPYQVKEQDLYQAQQRVEIRQIYPLYKFGFQNVVEAQFGHETYIFIAQQNGYYSHTSNACYLDQVMLYLFDYGDVSYRTLAGGFDNINYAMANELVDEQKGLTSKNGGIFLGHKLVNIQKMNDRYLLTFHVKNENTPVPMEDSFKSHLLSGVKKTKLYNLFHKGLRDPIPLPGKEGYSSIQFMADQLILAMPKKAIQLLYNEIDLLQEPISTYEELYKSDRRKYQSFLNLRHVKEETRRFKKFTTLNQDQTIEMERLLRKQQTHFRNPLTAPQISPNQGKRLIQLSERQFYNTVISKLNYDIKYEQEKIKRFQKDEAIVPKNLFSLTDSTQAMPAMKMMMNFSKNWWDPLEKISQCYKCPSQYVNLSKTVEEIRGTSMQDLSVRQTLQLSLGQENLLLCTYNDRITTQFWTTLHNNFDKVWSPKDEMEKSMKQNASKKIISVPPHQNIYQAKEVFVKEVLQELSRIHNVQVKQEWLKECVYQFWGNDKFGVGLHHFYSGYYIPSIMQCIRRPWKDESIHFVGEGFSNNSGWVEGAFQTAEMLLQSEFDLKPLVKGYYAGY